MNFCHTGCLSDKECGNEICSTPTDNDPTRHTNNCPHDKCCQPVVCKSSLPDTSGGELYSEGKYGQLTCDQGKVINPWKHIDPESSEPLYQVWPLHCVKKHDANNSTSGEWEVRNGLSADHIQCTEGRLTSSYCIYFYKQDYLPCFLQTDPFSLKTMHFCQMVCQGPNGLSKYQKVFKGTIKSRVHQLALPKTLILWTSLALLILPDLRFATFPASMLLVYYLFKFYRNE